MRTRVWTITCPACGIEMYSRAPHDCRTCKCGTMIDGGFSGYIRLGWPNGFKPPKAKIRYVNASREQLYRDWLCCYNKFGIIAGKKGPNNDR